MEKKELILCDSNIIIDVINGDLDTQQRLRKFNPERVFISVVTEMEVLVGAVNKLMLRQFKKSLKRYNIIQLDFESSLKASTLIKDYHLSHGMDIPDSLIAATALTHGLSLFTNNTKDFRFIPDLRLFQK
ncbi:MAG: type II toxin-antitoxin system VapC family toxin [Chlorobi bacterium]|nr:type II toxin-antitoxin system VapC family toxin [Chlorobiota bacterium]